MAGRFSIEAVIKAVDRVSAPVTRMSNRVGKATRKMAAGVQRFNTKMRAMAKTASSAFGVFGVAGAMIAAKMALTGLITLGAEFEQTLVGAGARFGGIRRGTAAFRELEKAARDVGARTEFTSKEAAGALNFLAKAGFSAEASIALLPDIVNLATAAEIDLARASDIASDAIGAFGLASDDAAIQAANFRRISDQMAVTVNKANTDLEQLFETIKKGAPAATVAGLSLENFLAVTARLAGTGLKASEAGTALKNVFLALAKSPVQEELKRMGVAVKDSNGDLLDFADILDSIGVAMAGKGGLDVASKLNELFGLRGVTSMAILVKEGSTALREFRGELLNSEGATSSLAGILRDTLGGAIKTLTSAFESLGLSIFKTGGTSFEDFIKSMTEGVRAVDLFVQRNPMVVKMAGAFLAIAAVGLIVAAVFAGIAAAYGFIVGSTTALIAVTIGAALAMGAWLISLEPVAAFFDRLQKVIASVKGGIVDMARAVGRFAAFGFGVHDEDSETAGRGDPQVFGPNRRGEVNREESATTSEVGLTIRAETGRVEFDKPDQRTPGVSIVLEPTGGL